MLLLILRKTTGNIFKAKSKKLRFYFAISKKKFTFVVLTI